MGELDSWHLIIQIVVLLFVAMVFGGILSRLGQSPLAGYLLAGMIVGGKGSLGLVSSEEHIHAIAELGVALLLFSLGLEFSLRRVRQLGVAVLTSGVVQVVLTLAIATAICLMFGLGLIEAIIVGAMVSLSSTAAVFRILMDRGEIDSPYGRGAVGILLVQDMAVVPLAILMTVLGGSNTPMEIVTDLGRITLFAAILVVVLYLVLNKVAIRALATLTLERNRELALLLAVVVGLGATWAAHEAGVSPALGAFVAGMFLGGSPFATQIRADVSSLRVILLTLFFGAVGMVANPIWIAQNLWLVLGVTACLLVVKTLIVWLILLAFGRPNRVAFCTGMCLAQVGEFAFVLGTTGIDGGALSLQTYQVVVSSAIVTLLLTPTLVASAPWIASLFARIGGRAKQSVGCPIEETGHSGAVFIVGFGPAGRAVASALDTSELPIVVIDLNSATRKDAERLGLIGHVGDARQLDVLQHAGIESARLVVVTVPMHLAGLTVLQHVRQLAPEAPVVVRSRHERYNRDYEIAGADAVIGDEAEVGKTLAREALARLAADSMEDRIRKAVEEADEMGETTDHPHR